MLDITIDGESGKFVSDNEYDRLVDSVQVQRGQVWERKGTSGSVLILVVAVDHTARIAVDRIVKNMDDAAAHAVPEFASGSDVGYARTFKDIRTKYTFVGWAW